MVPASAHRHRHKNSLPGRRFFGRLTGATSRRSDRIHRQTEITTSAVIPNANTMRAAFCVGDRCFSSSFTRGGLHSAMLALVAINEFFQR
jgi:hypothetical protein